MLPPLGGGTRPVSEHLLDLGEHLFDLGAPLDEPGLALVQWRRPPAAHPPAVCAAP
jgi:hypothetical protein